MTTAAPIVIERRGEVAVVTMSQDVIRLLDFEMDTAIKLVLDPLHADMPTAVVVNLGGITYMNSLGIAMLLRLHGRLRPKGCSMVIADPAPFIRDLLHNCALDTIWPVYDSVDAAIRSLTH
jgi:anti-anti-sigma factor